MTDTVKTQVMACKLTSPELQIRKQTVIGVLKQRVISRSELGNGYTYQFPAPDEMLDEIVAFVKTERACCSFFEFVITVTADTTILTITGPEGAKAFLQAELDL